MSLGVAGWAAIALAQAAIAAPTTLDTIKARRSLHCGGVPRPGLAMRGAEGGWSGLEVETCRAVSKAIFGAEARFDFHFYVSPGDFDRARTGDDDISFLAQSEIARQTLGDSVRDGPTIFVERQVLMVAEGSPYRRPADLAGHAICFIIATEADDALQAWAAAHKIDFIPNAFQEPDEMADAYNVQRCQAIVGEATELAAIRHDGGINHLESRLLPEGLATLAIHAATPRGGDRQWAHLVARTVALASPVEDRRAGGSR